MGRQIETEMEEMDGGMMQRSYDVDATQMQMQVAEPCRCAPVREKATSEIK